jgi:hypothetical protein
MTHFARIRNCRSVRFPFGKREARLNRRKMFIRAIIVGFTTERNCRLSRNPQFGNYDLDLLVSLASLRRAFVWFRPNPKLPDGTQELAISVRQLRFGSQCLKDKYLSLLFRLNVNSDLPPVMGTYHSVMTFRGKNHEPFGEVFRRNVEKWIYRTDHEAEGHLERPFKFVSSPSLPSALLATWE